MIPKRAHELNKRYYKTDDDGRSVWPISGVRIRTIYESFLTILNLLQGPFLSRSFALISVYCYFFFIFCTGRTVFTVVWYFNERAITSVWATRIRVPGRKPDRAGVGAPVEWGSRCDSSYNAWPLRRELVACPRPALSWSSLYYNLRSVLNFHEFLLVSLMMTLKNEFINLEQLWLHKKYKKSSWRV